jgi:hypothetical protein
VSRGCRIKALHTLSRDPCKTEAGSDLVLGGRALIYLHTHAPAQETERCHDTHDTAAHDGHIETWGLGVFHVIPCHLNMYSRLAYIGPWKLFVVP